MSTRVVGLERRLQPIGKIRLGDKVATKGGGARPHVLEKVRLTSSNPFLLHEAAKLYGGTVTRWDDAPAGTTQWELYVEAEALPIIIPPIESLSQCYECWSAKGCLRRCDNAIITHALDAAEIGMPCKCPSDPEARLAAAATGEACKLTTRISCMLPDVPGFGIWTIETHSYYASLWTAGMVEMLEAMAKQGRVIEATLKIERQSRKTAQGVRHFAIPVIQPQGMTPRQLFAQEMERALLPPAPQHCLPDETQKSLPEHISDLYGDAAGGTMLESLEQRINDLLTTQGTTDAKRERYWAAQDKKYGPRTEVSLGRMYDELAKLAEKKRGNASQSHQDAPGSTNAPQNDPGEGGDSQMPIAGSQEPEEWDEAETEAL